LRSVLAVTGDSGWINWWRLFRANALIAGALLALLRNASLIRIRWPAPLLGLATLAFVGALLVQPGSAAILRLGAYLAELISIGIALSILVDGHCPAVQAVLGARPVVYLGQLSYSLYLWQQLFCLRITGGRNEEFPLNLLFAGVAAVASHHLIELPCLRLRERWRKWLRPDGHPKPTDG
jgi:peptidoglycan/LPS O-acetylase OafA/YrhL